MKTKRSLFGVLVAMFVLWGWIGVLGIQLASAESIDSSVAVKAVPASAAAANATEGPPVIVSPTEDQVRNLQQGWSYALVVEAAGSLPLFYQWERSTNGGATFALLDQATNATYAIDSADVDHMGLFRCTASNAHGTATSPVFDVRVSLDVVPPVLVYACQTEGGAAVRLAFSTDIVINGDPLLYLLLDELSGQIRYATNLTVKGRTLTMRRFFDLFSGLEAPLDPAASYLLDLVESDSSTPTVADLFGNALLSNIAEDPVYGVPAYLWWEVAPGVYFQEGVNGYAGTRDTQIHSSDPDSVLSDEAYVRVDGDQGGGVVQGLIQFENLFGGGAGRIPSGATVLHAELRLQSAEIAVGTDIRLHRMLVPWSENTTWNAMGDGIQVDGVEASADSISFEAPPVDEWAVVDVTEDVEAWASFQSEPYGWALVTDGTDGWEFHSSDAVFPEVRPKLSVCWIWRGTCTDVPDITDDPVDVTITEPGRVSLSVIAICGETYQWRKDGVDIPDATGYTYVIDPSVPSDSGMYDVVVGNEFGNSTSGAAMVTVNPDTVPPTMDSIVADGDAGTITLSFSEPLAVGPAQDTANYAISVVGGGTLAVNGAVLQGNGTDVVLTTDAPSFDIRYTMDISGLTDLAATANEINPITIRPLVFEYLILDWDATWSYTTNGLVEATVPGWEQPGYDASAWLTGAGLFGLETSGDAPIPVPPGIQTPFTLVDENTNWIHTFYFRTTVNVPIADTSDVTFEFRHLIDDGAVAYIGGREAFRYNMPEDVTPVTYSNEATDAIDASLRTNGACMPSGDSVVAIEVHQGNVGSSDVLFGTQIVAQAGKVHCHIIEPWLAFTFDGDDIVLWWGDTQYILLSAPSLMGPYTEVVGATSPHTVTPASGKEFFALGEAP